MAQECSRLPGADPEPDSIVGNLANLAAGQVLLPRFVLQRDDGLVADLSMLDSGRDFLRFVEQVFAAGALLRELDYPVFLKLLYEPEAEDLLKTAKGRRERPEIRFARAIAPFSPERRALYRNIRIEADGSCAEYMFEPLLLDVEKEVPLYGDPDEQGVAPVVGHEIRIESVRTQADPDEFVAAMWEKGLRFGLRMAEVRRALESARPERLEIARALPPSAGTDANLVEKTDALHRDDAPAVLPNGRIDLRHFKNRFPQVQAGTRLLQKVPRALGRAGRNVQGETLEPELPQDFDIDPLAGPGTRVERTGEGEFVTAAITGFLNIDVASSCISVTEKIINRCGISMRTTGDLNLAGAEFEEYGEVQERRVVEGQHMSFHADVFGRIVSAGGEVMLKANLAGGGIDNPGGRVTVAGTTSRATIEARGGEIFLASAENSRVVGGRVHIARAVNCEVLGDTVEIGECLGSAVAGRRIALESSAHFRNVESVISVLIPDEARWQREDVDRVQEQAALAARGTALENERARLAATPGLEKLLAARKAAEAGSIQLGAAQEAALRNMLARFGAQIRRLAEIARERAAIEQAQDALAGQAAAALEERAAARAAVACTIAAVRGETVVVRIVETDDAPYRTLGHKELHRRLRDTGHPGNRIYAGESAAVDWRLV